MAAKKDDALTLIGRLRAQQDQRTEAALRFWASHPPGTLSEVLSAAEIGDVPAGCKHAALELMKVGAMVVMTALAEWEVNET